MADFLEEHIDYLSIEGRRELYEAALGQIVKEGDAVADLGCGFGILGILALQAGAKRVWGIDRTDSIEIARETVRRLGVEHRYQCIRGSTFRTRLPELVDVLVCDHVGYFGFDYGIVGMVADARRRLLKPGGKIIPRQIILHVAGSTGACGNLVDAWTKDPVPPEFAWLQDRAANTKYKYSFRPDELCTNPEALGVISLEADPPGLLSFEARLEVSHDCELNGIACWFDCELAPGIRMTNSPLAEHRINRPNAFLPCKRPFTVRAGTTVEVSCKISLEPVIITWTLREPATGSAQRHSTWSSTLLRPYDLVEGDARALQLNAKGHARRTILELSACGSYTLAEVEDAILAQYPDLFPSEGEIRRFVRHELGDNVL